MYRAGYMITNSGNIVYCEVLQSYIYLGSTLSIVEYEEEIVRL